MDLAPTGRETTKIAKPFATDSQDREAGRKLVKMASTLGIVILSTKGRRWISRCVTMHLRASSTSVSPVSMAAGIIMAPGVSPAIGLHLTDAALESMLESHGGSLLYWQQEINTLRSGTLLDAGVHSRVVAVNNTFFA